MITETSRLICDVCDLPARVTNTLVSHQGEHLDVCAVCQDVKQELEQISSQEEYSDFRNSADDEWNEVEKFNRDHFPKDYFDESSESYERNVAEHAALMKELALQEEARFVEEKSEYLASIKGMKISPFLCTGIDVRLSQINRDIIASIAHDVWCAQQLSRGLTSKILENGEDCMISYFNLSKAQQVKDLCFADAVLNYLRQLANS